MILNGKNAPLNQSSSMPDVSGALLGWFQKMVFTTIVKTVVNFKVTEIPTEICFQGVWQPFTAQQLQMKPEGQRNWKWFTVHAQPSLVLKPDDVVTYLGVQYRVMGVLDYKLDGYVEYHLIEDYVRSGP